MIPLIKFIFCTFVDIIIEQATFSLRIIKFWPFHGSSGTIEECDPNDVCVYADRSYL